MFERLADVADSYIEESLRDPNQASVLDLCHPVVLASVGAASFAEVFPATSDSSEVEASALFESFINQLGKEDWCFAGTTGELAYRLLLAVTASVLESGEELPEEPYLRPRALAAFKGVPVFGSRIRNIRGDSDQTHTELSYPDSGRFNSSWPAGISATLSRSYSLRNSVWIAPDGSSAGFGIPPSGTSRVLIQIPLSVYPNAARILSSIVFLIREVSGAYTLRLYEDLKFGAFSPLASRLLLPSAVELETFVPLLSAGTPSGVFDALASRLSFSVPSAPNFEGLDLPSFIIAEVVDDSGVYLWWGFTNTLGPQVRCAVQLTPLVAWLAFGPPHHYLAPFPPQTAVRLSNVFRFWNGPKELEPEVLLSDSEPSELAAWLLGRYSAILSK